MKKLLIIGAAVAALTATAPAASALPWQSINERQANLDARIDAGVRDGSLTRTEAVRVRGEFNDLARLEARYRVNGLTIGERRDLDSRFDRLSQEVSFQRNDNQNRGDGRWVSINERQRDLDARIDAGIRDGSLTRLEARRLRTQFGSLRSLEASYRRNGLSVSERRDLDVRFDRLSAQIRDQRHDWQRR